MKTFNPLELTGPMRELYESLINEGWPFSYYMRNRALQLSVPGTPGVLKIELRIIPIDGSKQYIVSAAQNGMVLCKGLHAIGFINQFKRYAARNDPTLHRILQVANHVVPPL